MTFTQKRFLAGGLGALIPIAITLLLVDAATIAEMLDTEDGGYQILGWGVKSLLLFLIGGVWVYFDSMATDLKKAFRLGMAAPAVITTTLASNNIDFTQEKAAAIAAPRVITAGFTLTKGTPAPPAQGAGKCFIKGLLGKPCR
jgi:Na+-transporting methylmalonyl-CoA/oxaloacetate decarboxylase beta subunit